ncbi:MAG: exonuclease SbcD [Candidatus Promineifilaceae bacterium]|jgi:exonuclease SbcD
MALKILCVGDIHLGKVVTRLPDVLADFGINVADLSPASAWRRTWERAIEDQVDALLIAGDLVEDENERFAAIHHLGTGLRALTQHDISVFAVSGNHDGTALTRMSRHLGDLHHLGKDGQWESAACTARDGTPFEVLGWSFPERHFPENPFDAFETPAPSNGLRIGLLHADLDGGASSRYAPVTRADLERVRCDAWCMGHVHKPSPMDEAPHAGYLGSLVGLDPGEPGRHGPWMLSWDSRQGMRMRQLGLAPVRWESLVIDLSEMPVMGQRDDVADALQSALHAAADQLMQSWDADDRALAVGCRVRLEGRSDDHAATVLAAQQLRQTPWQVRNVVFFIEHLEDHAAPAIDLDSLARTRTPPGRLARQIQLLQSGGSESDALLQSARESMLALGVRSQWREASRASSLSDDALRQRLTSNAMQMLETLLAQKEVAQS